MLEVGPRNYLCLMVNYLDVGGAAIAQWIVCAYHPAAPGSSPKHTIYAFKKNYLDVTLT